MIEINNLSLEQNKIKSLENINIRINEGEIIGVIGESGSGKTALLKTIAGISPKYTGEILLTNRSLQSYKKNLLNQLLSCSFEEIPHNNDDTVFDFLLQSRIPYKKFLNPFSEYDIQITEECLHQFNLNTYKNNKILSLPGAILKRCHLAYCFIREAKVTILDNPTSDLDFHSIFTLQRYMSKYVMDGNKIIIIASNDLNFVIQTSDRIIILKDGEIALEGTHNMIDGETIKKYFNIDIIYSKNIYNGKPVINLFPMN